jgi:quinone-modifying oxidoreductase subunit QmoC
MVERQRLEPDLEFIRELKASGGGNVKKCFQCATCSVICNLSADEQPFPRKQMHLAQWGQKERLLADPALWLCHNCGDCTTYCPRGADPGDVINALRAEAIKHYSVPRFIGRMVNEVRYFPLVILLPIFFFLVFWASVGGISFPPGPVKFSKMFPHLPMNLTLSALSAALAGGMIYSIAQFWGDMKRWHGGIPNGDLIGSIKKALRELLLHEKFRGCEANSLRFWSHLGIFYGFIGLVVVTGFVVVLAVLEMYPLPIYHPLKIMGNISALMLIAGAGSLIVERWKDQEAGKPSSYYDWLLLTDVFAVGLTGFFLQFARYGEAPGFAYPLYFTHLVFVFILIFFLPYTKLAHLAYRFTAMVFTHYTKPKGQAAQP